MKLLSKIKTDTSVIMKKNAKMIIICPFHTGWIAYGYNREYTLDSPQLVRAMWKLQSRGWQSWE